MTSLCRGCERDCVLPTTEVTISCLKSEIVDPESNIASTGTLLIVTNVVEFVCRTIATVTTSVWPDNWDTWWSVQMSL